MTPLQSCYNTEKQQWIHDSSDEEEEILQTLSTPPKEQVTNHGQKKKKLNSSPNIIPLVNFESFRTIQSKSQKPKNSNKKTKIGNLEQTNNTINDSKIDKNFSESKTHTDFPKITTNELLNSFATVDSEKTENDILDIIEKSSESDISTDDIVISNEDNLENVDSEEMRRLIRYTKECIEKFDTLPEDIEYYFKKQMTTLENNKSYGRIQEIHSQHYEILESLYNSLCILKNIRFLGDKCLALEYCKPEPKKQKCGSSKTMFLCALFGIYTYVWLSSTAVFNHNFEY